MVAKLSSAKTSSAACLATSVPERPIAMPMWACFNAGASFTPSPVIATTWPSARYAFTMRSFCSAVVRAKTRRSIALCRSSSSLILARSVPVTTRSPAVHKSSSFAMATAVMGWSPVIMTMRTPASLHTRMAPFTELRGGSFMATMPSSVSASSGLSAGRTRRAIASTRRASPLIRSASACTRFLSSSVMPRTPSSVAIFVQSGKSTSRLPFTCATARPFESSVTTVMRLRSESNGSSRTTLCEMAIDSFARPPFAASVRSAPSVGSPMTFQRSVSASRSSRAFVQSAAVARR